MISEQDQKIFDSIIEPVVTRATREHPHLLPEFVRTVSQEILSKYWSEVLIKNIHKRGVKDELQKSVHWQALLKLLQK